MYICFAIVSGSGMCDASQLPPDRLVLSITCTSGTHWHKAIHYCRLFIEPPHTACITCTSGVPWHKAAN